MRLSHYFGATLDCHIRRLARDVMFIPKTRSLHVGFNTRENVTVDEEPDYWLFQLLILGSCFSPWDLYYRGWSHTNSAGWPAGQAIQDSNATHISNISFQQSKSQWGYFCTTAKAPTEPWLDVFRRPCQQHIHKGRSCSRHVARIVSLGAASVFGGQTYFEYYYTAITC